MEGVQARGQIPRLASGRRAVGAGCMQLLVHALGRGASQIGRALLLHHRASPGQIGEGRLKSLPPRRRTLAIVTWVGLGLGLGLGLGSGACRHVDGISSSSPGIGGQVPSVRR